MKKQIGFTLIELLVVIFIISILTGIGLVSFSGAQKQARDAARRSDLGQYRNGLESYAANNGSVYPFSALANAATLCDGSTKPLYGYLASCLDDSDTSRHYRYQSNSAAIKYILYASLETSGYCYVCSTGRSAYLAIEPVLTINCL
ncbi:MAG: type II secretion system protein [Candidatus Komeilibacteria bacterium]|nr:type II secretion system protein [Candidatus Komeilibacteria bacterium]